jgi:uncharacterized repeat protein (TIGR01451 family)
MKWARWAAWLPALLLAQGAARGALLADPEVARALPPAAASATLADTPVRVIVQYRDADAPAHEGPDPARTRRGARKQGVQRALGRALDATQWRETHDFSELPMNALELRSRAALDALLAHADVEAVFLDRPIKLFTDSSLTLVRQPAVANTMHRTGAGQTIAVIDTGVNYTLAGLGSCTAPGTGSGCKVVASYYTATGTASPASGSGLDDIGHGSEVAQVALAVAPDARIAAVGVFSGGTASSSDIIAGINWAISNRSTYNIVAINMSLGDGVEHTAACTTLNSAFASPIKSARNKGIVVVAASGNDAYSSGISAPACVSEAIAVGAVYSANWGAVTWSNCSDSATAADQVTCFSDSSSLLDLWAPGAFYNLDGNYIAGTSFAAPMTAGAVAVLKAQFTSDTVSATESRLLTSATTITDARNGISRPRLDLVSEQGAPGNDAFASATALSGLSVGGSLGASSWNYNATAQTGEPQHAGVTSGGHSVWWSWTAPADGVLTVSTSGSDFDTLLGVYTGSSVSALTSVAANDDASSSVTTSAATLAVSSGQTYAIAVDGKSGAQGGIALALTLSAPRADLGVSLASSATALYAGASVTLTATVSNAGPSSAASAVLSFTLPSGLVYTSGPAACSSSVASGITTVSCALGSLAASASQTLSIVATATETGTPAVTADISSGTADATSANNLASASLTVSDNDSADTPLPAWALALLGASLTGAARRNTLATRRR